jgi:hypothetical protein
MNIPGFKPPWKLKYLGGLVCPCLTQIAWAQLQLTTVRGTALGPDSRPVRDATVRLLDLLGNAVAATMTDTLGIFLFQGVAPGTYSLQAETAQLRSPARPLTVNSALPIEADIRLVSRLDEKLVVTDTPEVPAVTKRFSFAGESVRRSPVHIQSRGLQAAVATLPGFSTEDSGLLHHRGVDDGILYVQDGLPIYDCIDTLFGVPPGSSTMTSINVLTGYIPPEFGFKSGGVVEVRSEADLRDSWSGTFELGLGSYATHEVSAIALGPNVGAAGVTYEHAPSGFWSSVTGRHESGTPLEVGDEQLDELMERPGSELVNFARGRIKPRTLFDVMAGRTLVRRDRFELTARLEILNLTNQEYALNFGIPSAARISALPHRGAQASIQSSLEEVY